MATSRRSASAPDPDHPDAGRWRIWDLHQKLWNADLVDRLDRVPGGARMVRSVIRMDTVLLAVRAVLRRLRHLGPRALRRRPLHLPPRVLYIDCGLHREGRELRTMQDWFGSLTRLDVLGFEASPDHFAVVAATLAGAPSVDLRNVALIGADYAEPTVRLYRSGGSGKADSLFAVRGEDFDVVPAVRLSSVLAEYLAVHGPTPVVLRMNIEGAEEYVVDDLIEAGLVTSITGYYGMWDDVGKIDPDTDRRFRRRLRAVGIRTHTFNDRDYRDRLRMRVIRYDITTTLAAVRRG